MLRPVLHVNTGLSSCSSFFRKCYTGLYKTQCFCHQFLISYMISYLQIKNHLGKKYGTGVGRYSTQYLQVYTQAICHPRLTVEREKRVFISNYCRCVRAPDNKSKSCRIFIYLWVVQKQVLNALVHFAVELVPWFCAIKILCGAIQKRTTWGEFIVSS